MPKAGGLTAREALSRVPYFASLNPETLGAIVQASVRRQYQADQVVFLEGEPSSGLFVVEDGWLKAVKTSSEGREQVLHVIGPGEVFNAVGVFVSATNPSAVIALEPSTLWVIGRKSMQRLLAEHPCLSRMIIENLAERVQHLVTLVEDLSLRTVEARLARMLLEQASRGTVERRRWATQAEMAARLGTVPDVVNRALRVLVDDNLIEVTRQQIRIIDITRLEARADLRD
jgi:CRP/FNR family cyclic AMP-dependent transcriptional regulator